MFLVKGVMDPVYKLVLPFGGNQLKKTIQGAEAISEGKSTDKVGRAQFDVGGTFLKDAQALTFGKYAGSEAQDYFDNDTSYAEAKYAEMKKSPTAREDFNKLKKEDPNLAEAIKKVAKDEKLGITDEEKKIRNMGVANKDRAEAVYEKFNDLETNEEKHTLWNEYVKKGILTKDVKKQVKEMLANPPPKTNIIKKVIDTVFGVKTADAAEISKRENKFMEYLNNRRKS